MLTTIQVNEHTLELLKKLKQELQAASYEEAITKIAAKYMVRESMAGSLKKYVKKKLTHTQILEGLRDKHDRF